MKMASTKYKVWSTFCFLLAILDSCFSQGQNYFFGRENAEEFYTEPAAPYVPSFQPRNYFLQKDLETSDLPTHLQKSLPQYQQDIPIPFRLAKDYVKPSTHRPDFSHLLPQRYQHEILNTKVDYLRVPKTLTNNQWDDINPVTNANKNNQNQIDLNLTKRDSTEEAADEEYDEEENEEVQKSDKLHEKGNNELEYDDEEYEYEDEEESPINETNKDIDAATQKPATSNIITQLPVPKIKEEKKFPELVVSVVTSKTVVNNTITLPQQNLSTTESSVVVENSTDSWIVIASVQTSRSISGARYIPSSIVDQDERIQLLNEPSVTDPTTDFVTETEAATPKTKASTESLIDKLDRVQSDLSSGLLSGGYKNDNIAVIEENLSTKMETTTEEISVMSKAPYPQVNIRKFNPGNRARPKTQGKVSSTTTPKIALEQAKGNTILQKAKPVDDISALLPPGYKLPSTGATIKEEEDISALLPPGYKSPDAIINKVLSKAKPVDDISALLPPGYKPPETTTKSIKSNILSKVKPLDDISALLPPGYKPPKSENVLAKAKPVDDISALLPPGYELKPESILSKAKPVDDISALLPPGYKPKPESILSKAKPVDDISALLPPGYKPKPESILSKAKPVDDISALLPPGYNKASTSTEKSVNKILSKAVPVDDISALLPPGYKKSYGKGKSTTPASASSNIPDNLLPPGFKLNDTAFASSTSSATTPPTTSTTASGFKIVFPSRPGGSKKTPRLTTPKIQSEEVMNKPTSPTIQKGWPIRASTEFTGWKTPSTTPISIEKLLEAARAAASSTSTETVTETTSTTTTTTTTTTTVRPTTPGICVDNCDLAGTIRLVGGAKWVPELLDRNTKEYQILANSVQSELENIYNGSPKLQKWYTKIRIDGFSEGSVLVDYLVEFNEIGQKVDTQEIKRLFHESLGISTREGKSLNETKAERLTLGKFEVDPEYTDFVVIPKNPFPTVGYADDVLLPQWAIAVIVIGLASLLFVIVFGVTVLFNRHKNSKKTPAPLTEDMLNELNKNHMGGLENYGVDDFYNMEDVWSEKHYQQKPPKKQRPNNGSSLYDNSTANLYDSWQSQWNGQWSAYKNYGNSSQYSGHSGRHRRPEYDTNF
ncbi:unnamed protein product [Ceutorhynchus assimilis]|uniref:SEA domain-containing protein n=1 Tax=Ceutorhynchus assimilis TaxID=467358 RepID=A0A9N9QHC0_9CUCU|nr:unnamed protein product [Ceutorhynchus assimilis]